MSAAGGGFWRDASGATVATPEQTAEQQAQLRAAMLAARAAGPSTTPALPDGIPPGSAKTGGNNTVDVYTDPNGNWYAINKNPNATDANGNPIPVGALDPSWSNGQPVGTERNAGGNGVGDFVTGVVGPAIGGALGGITDIGKAELSPQAAGNIQAAIARSSGLADNFGNQAANYQAVGAPTIQSPAAIQAALAAQGAPVQAGQAAAQQAEAARIAQTALAGGQQAIVPDQVAGQQVQHTALAGQQNDIRAQQIAAAQIAAAQQAPGATVGATTVGPTAQAGGVTINAADQAALRARQLGLVDQYDAAIQGREPSAAEIMLRNATDRNVANQYALAQAANGMNTGQAQRLAMINSADLNQQAIMQQALLRAQEIAGYRQAQAGVLDSTRGADIGLATNQAGLTQQTNLANTAAQNTSTLTQAQIDAARATQQAQLAQQSGQFNAGQANDIAQQQAQLQQAASIANQGASLAAGTSNATLAQQVAMANAAAQNTTAQQNAQLGQQAQLANQQTNLAAGTTNMTLAQQLALANAAAQNTTAQQNATMQQAAGLQNAQLGTQTAIANANNTTGANTSSAQLANAVNLANANNQSQANLTSGQLAAQVGIANAGNQVSTNALNQKAQQDLYGNQLTASGQNTQGALGQGNIDAELAKAEAARQAALVGAGGTILGKLIS